MLNAEQLRAIMPGLSAAKCGELLPFLQAAMEEFAIGAPARAAAFIAQLAHESGQFRFMEEIWGPTAAQRRYEPQSSLAAALGNTEAGDGKKFKGRGPIQVTGRANYRRFGGHLGLDLLSNPERAAVPDVAFRIAGLYWSKKGLNELADLATADAFREITRRINGGFNGLPDRQKFYEAARTTLGVAAPPAPRGSERALPDPREMEEGVFERGNEAIRAHVPRKRRRKAAPSKRKTKTRGADTRLRRTRSDSSGKSRTVARRRKSAAGPKSRRKAASPASRRKR